MTVSTNTILLAQVRAITGFDQQVVRAPATSDQVMVGRNGGMGRWRRIFVSTLKVSSSAPSMLKRCN